MSKEIYDVFKAQKVQLENLVLKQEELIDQTQNSNKEAFESLNNSEIVMEDNKEFIKSLGINLEDELCLARENASQEIDLVINEINKVKTIKNSYDFSFDELVKNAHERGYIDTQLQDLLTDEEINSADDRFKNIEDEFRLKTKLEKRDIVFLTIAVALQVTRQYVLDPIIKECRKNAGSSDEKAKENKSPGWYRVPTDKILINAVPFDATRYSDNSTIKDFLKGYKNHRDATLGHDPILGWIFGTVNIMTGTITNCSLDSAHIKYMPGKGNVIHSQADTFRIFTTITDRVLSEGIDGKMALAFSVIREAIHLKSDIGTKHSLPLPGINLLCPKLATKLANYGIDSASVGTEASLSFLINLIISMIHRIIKSENEDEKLYAVRTRKILLISNLIASTSNIVAVGIAAGIGTSTNNSEFVKKSINYLDVGGILITLTRLFSDVKFIAKVKEEFINSKLDEELINQLNKLDKYL